MLFHWLMVPCGFSCFLVFNSWTFDRENIWCTKSGQKIRGLEKSSAGHQACVTREPPNGRCGGEGCHRSSWFSQCSGTVKVAPVWVWVWALVGQAVRVARKPSMWAGWEGTWVYAAAESQRRLAVGQSWVPCERQVVLSDDKSLLWHQRPSRRQTAFSKPAVWGKFIRKGLLTKM
jgi:hypothetical protein